MVVLSSKYIGIESVGKGVRLYRDCGAYLLSIML
jgi:hypothetical protein